MGGLVGYRKLCVVKQALLPAGWLQNQNNERTDKLSPVCRHSPINLYSYNIRIFIITFSAINQQEYNDIQYLAWGGKTIILIKNVAPFVRNFFSLPVNQVNRAEELLPTDSLKENVLKSFTIITFHQKKIMPSYMKDRESKIPLALDNVALNDH